MTESKSKEKPNKDEWKVCSRGHSYKGSSGCPMCWKLNRPKPLGTSTKDGR